MAMNTDWATPFEQGRPPPDEVRQEALFEAQDDERAGVFRIVPVPLQGTMRPIGAAVRATGEPSPDVVALLAALREVTGAR